MASTTHTRELPVGALERVIAAEPVDSEAIATPSALVRKFGTVVPGALGFEVAVSNGLVIHVRAD